MRAKPSTAVSNRNLTKEEEFILEHVTAFVYRKRRSAPQNVTDERITTNAPTNAEMLRWQSMLNVEHIKRISPDGINNTKVEFHCTICLLRLENVFQVNKRPRYISVRFFLMY